MGDAFSKDGSLMAYSLSSGGSDWRRVKFLELDTLTSKFTEMPDVLNHVKFSSMAWSHDHKCASRVSGLCGHIHHCVACPSEHLAVAIWHCDTARCW